MSPADAAKLLDLPTDATPEQLEARFLELRRKLEDKIAKAPTPGLQAKYRESLAEITTAFETLTLAADSSSLPVIQKQGAGSKEQGVQTSRSQDSGTTFSPSSKRPAPSSSRPKSGGKEFALVAAIAVLVLAAGGWFVIKTRADHEAKAVATAEAQAAKDRQAADAKAEQDRLALERKKNEEAETTRREKLFAQLRGDLAEAKVTWEALEREERSADRKLAELKSDLRGLKDVAPGRLAEARATVSAHQRYYDWISETLARHPAKVARGKAEELVSARQVDDAALAVADLKKALADLDREVVTQRKRALDLDGELVLATDANVSWQLEDAFGQIRTGTGPAELDGLAIGPAKVQLRKPSWPERIMTVVVSVERPAKLEAAYATHMLELNSEPEGVEVADAQGTKLGVTPYRVADLPPGRISLTLSKEGYYPETVELTLPVPGNVARPVALRIKPKGFVRPPRWKGPASVRVDMQVSSQSTGSYASNTTMHFIEEWDFSNPDPKLGWQQATRRFVALSGTNREYMPVDGSALRLRRQPDGTWAGEFVQGGLKNPEHNKIWASAQTSFWLVHFALQDLFPPSPVEPGETWTVKPEFFFRTIGLGNATGSVQGRLVGLDHEGAADWADVEYSYNYNLGTISGQSVLRLRVNLSDGYVVRMEGRDSSTAGELKISASHTTSVTLR